MRILLASCMVLTLVTGGCGAADDGATEPNEQIDAGVTDVPGGDTPACVPDCQGRTCGSDGCGSVCGTCTDGTTCEDGLCIEPVAASCEGVCGMYQDSADCQCDANCFLNGDCCEDICDVCMDVQSIADSCEPPPVCDCTGKQCGDDGCGNSCGDCAAGSTCQLDGTCLEDEVPPATSCEGVCDQFLGQDGCNCDAECWKFDDCCEDICDVCATEHADECTPCEPACAPGQECGDDGCGGTCGAGCTGDEVCTDDGLCEVPCAPACDGKDCGDDGCGGTCGDGCTGDELCTDDGLCEVPCAPACDGKDCGDDGCGGTCGDGCQADEVCTDDGLCEVPCVPACDGKDCGGDGCGGTCAPGCDADTACNAFGQCVGLPLNGTLVTTFTFVEPAGDYGDCEVVTALVPGGVPEPGCAECDYTWNVVFYELDTTCSDVWYTSDAGNSVSVGIDLDTQSLMIFDSDAGEWGPYDGSGAIDANTFVGEGTFEGYYVDQNGNDAYDEGEDITYTEGFILSWLEAFPPCGDDLCETGETPTSCAVDCADVVGWSPWASGALVTSTTFLEPTDEYANCKQIMNISPAGNAAAGCDACDYTWATELQPLTNTCGEWAGEPAGSVVHLGLDLDNEQLWVNQNQGDGWLNYAGVGTITTDAESGITSYLGTWEDSGYYVDQNANDAYDAGEDVTLGETFILVW